MANPVNATRRAIATPAERLTMLNRVAEGRVGDDAVLVMAGAYRSYAHHHPGRYSAFTRTPLSGGDDPEFTAATKEAAEPVIAVLSSYGLDAEQAFTRRWNSGRQCTGSCCWK